MQGPTFFLRPKSPQHGGKGYFLSILVLFWHVPLQWDYKHFQYWDSCPDKSSKWHSLRTLLPCVVLLLLDVCGIWHCHYLLLERMSNRFGGEGQVLKWFRSCLLDRKQFVIVDRVKSAVKDLYFGQGSILGLILYLLYTLPLGDIIKHHNLDFTFMLTILSSIWPLSLMQPNNLAQFSMYWSMC